MRADMHVNIFACICVFKMNFLWLYFVTFCSCICFFLHLYLRLSPYAKCQNAARFVNYYGLACTLLWIRIRIYPHSLYISLCLFHSPIRLVGDDISAKSGHNVLQAKQKVNRRNNCQRKQGRISIWIISTRNCEREGNII